MELMEDYDDEVINAITELKSIQKARIAVGLPALNKAEIKCLKCNKLFLSQDTRSNRICEKCKAKQEHLSQHYLSWCS